VGEEQRVMKRRGRGAGLRVKRKLRGSCACTAGGQIGDVDKIGAEHCDSVASPLSLFGFVYSHLLWEWAKGSHITEQCKVQTLDPLLDLGVICLRCVALFLI
jgi:hypothetical protein